MSLHYKLLLILCMLHMVQTVKIGISRPSETTTTITPPATATTTTAIPNETTTELTEEYTETSFLLDTTQNVPSTTTPPPNNTTVRYFQVPTLPSRTAKPRVVKVRPTKTTTTTTTLTPDEYDTDDVDDNGDGEENAKRVKSTTKEYAGEIGANNFYCSCNLLPNDCDINCCCDTDCSAEALKVFDCYAVPKHPELRTRLEDFQYQHGLPSCRVNDGWLCVIRSNVKTEPQKALDTHLNTNKFYKWPSLMSETTQTPTKVNSMQYYRFGEPLQLINVETLEINHFGNNFDLNYLFSTKNLTNDYNTF